MDGHPAAASPRTTKRPNATKSLRAERRGRPGVVQSPGHSKPDIRKRIRERYCLGERKVEVARGNDDFNARLNLVSGMEGRQLVDEAADPVVSASYRSSYRSGSRFASTARTARASSPRSAACRGNSSSGSSCCSSIRASSAASARDRGLQGAPRRASARPPGDGDRSHHARRSCLRPGRSRLSSGR